MARRATVAYPYRPAREPAAILISEEDVEDEVEALRRRASDRLDAEEPIDATLPEIASRAYRCAADPRTSILEIARLVAQDPPLAGRLIQVANSAIYSHGNRVASLEEAILRLGLQAVRQLVIMPTIKSRMLRCPAAHAIWERATAAAVAARVLASFAGLPPDTAFLSGLLLDAGRILLLVAGAGQASSEAVEALHAEVAGFLLRRWSIDRSVVDAVRRHHEPDSSLSHLLCVAEVVSLAAIRHLPLDIDEIPSVAHLRLPRAPTANLARRVPGLVAELAL
jgi:HD-like signal output (HDOD) protein